TLRQYAKQIRDGNDNMEDMLGNIYSILCIHVGKPPTEFDWKYQDLSERIIRKRNLTPLIFSKMIDFRANDYIMLANNPMEKYPYNALYESTYYRNVIGGLGHRYINVTMDIIIKCITKSILSGDPVAFSAEISYSHDSSDGVFDPDL